MRIAIFAPHQDDELNLFGPLFEKYIKLGYKIDIIFVTNGDFDNMQRTRYKESQKIKNLLKITRTLYFGFPDNGPNNIKESTIYNHINLPYISKTNLTSSYHPIKNSNPDFFFTAYNLDVPAYTRTNLLNTFIKYLELVKPEVIISTGWDYHPRSSNYFLASKRSNLKPN